MNNPTQQYYDNNTLYVDCGVATERQISDSLKIAIHEAEKLLAQKEKDRQIKKAKDKIRYCRNSNKRKQLKQELDKLTSKPLSEFHKQSCRYKINLLVNKDGAYLGFGYIRVSLPEIYWMLLGRNPDGSERFEDIPDPDWVAPGPKSPTTDFEEILEEEKKKTWAEMAEEEEQYIQPIIRHQLDALICIPGYKYDAEQLQHLRELAVENSEDPTGIPETGFFEISRGYAKDAPPGRLKHRLCARRVPDWVPLEAFKYIFSPYIIKLNKRGSTNISNRKIEGTYPLVNFIDSKKGRIVFVTFDPASKDALFALLMTKKTRIIHPENEKLRCELIFTHAFDNKGDKR